MIKVTRKLLDNYRKVKKEIPVLEAELREMQQGDNGIGHSIIMDYRTGFPHPSSVIGPDWKLFDRRRKVLERKQNEAKAVESWIESIEDGQTRCVFRMYYINGMSWERIAMETGYAGKADYVRLMIRDAYLKKCGIK